MKWIYGKQDWKTLERGMENCWLLTDGLGGYSSLTVTGAAARGDHALFMACVRSPGQQVNMVHRLRETLERGEQKWLLSTQEFADGSAGYHLDKDTTSIPRWLLLNRYSRRAG